MDLFPEGIPQSPPEGWFSVDELSNALDAVEKSALFLETLNDPYRWKWTAIAVHQAIYGFAICAVRGTDSRSVLEPPNKKGERRLISIWKALERTQSEKFLWPTAKPLALSDHEDWALRRLFEEFRNGFAHFQPCGWSIEMLAFVEVLTSAVAVLRRLAVEQDLVLYYDDADRESAATAFDRLERSLAEAGSG